MALLDDFNLTTNTDFLNRIEMAIVSTAIAVQAESVSTASHAMRSSYALKVLANPQGYAALMAPGMTVDASLTAGSTDQNIKDRASAIWNAYCVQS